jgi:hypothetical protein
MSGQAPDGAVASRLRLDPVLLGGGLLVVLQTIVRASIAFPSYYLHDDFLHLEMARRLGLSHDFLVRDYAGHLEVGQYFLYWLIGRHGGLSFAPAATSLVVMQVLASGLLLAVLRVLFGRSPWILLPFAGYLFTPLSLTVATWWAAGLQAMPLQIAMLLTLLGVVLAIRRRSWVWAAISVLGHALGLVFWEKAVLILPAVLVVLLLVEWAREPWGSRLRLLVGQWRALLPHVLLLAAYVGIYLSVVDGSSVLGQQARDVGRNTGDTVFRMLVPGIFGGPWSEAGAVSTVYPYVGNGLAIFFAALLLVVVASSVWLRGVRALQAWLLVAGYVAVDIALLQVGRADFIGLLSRDPRYITDSLPVIAIGFCAAFCGPRVTRRTPRWFPQAVASADSPLGAIAVLVASCLLTSFLVDQVLQHDYSRNYVHGLVEGLEQNPNASVISTPVPQDVSVSTDHEGLLRAVGEEQEFDQPSTDMRMVDGLGTLRPVTVTDPTLERSGPVEDCGWPVAGRWQPLGTLRPASGPQILRLTYVTGQEAVLHLSVGPYEQAVAVPVGAGYATFVVTGHDGPVRARVTDVASGGLCVMDEVAGAPWPAD